MKRDDDNDEPEEEGGRDSRPTRDANGRWLKGHCPNPRGRPKKPPKEPRDPGDLWNFGNTMIDVVAHGEKVMMDRRAALLHKMFESAMKGKVSQQRFLYKEFENNFNQLLKARTRYIQLMADWVINNPDFTDPDFEMPFEVEFERASLEALLHHYFPTQFRDPKPSEPDDDEE